MQLRLTRLKTECEAAVTTEDLQPKDGATFCNVAVDRICRNVYGIEYFKDKMANQICDILDNSGEWDKIKAKDASYKSLQGLLVIASLPADPHGHVAVVYPSGLVYSAKWKSDCPLVSNVGKKNGIMGANWAFDSVPRYHAWKGLA